MRSFFSFFAVGAAASLGMHLFFFGGLTPRMAPERFSLCQPSAVFLGAALSPSDIAALRMPLSDARRQAQIPLPPAGNRPDYHAKQAPAPIKPLPDLTDHPVTVARPQEPSRAASRSGGALTGERLRFYLFEPPAVVSNVDFSDLRKMAEREDVAAEMELAVTLGPGGSVRRVQRIVGSGNPILDSFVIFKIQRAVFLIAGADEGAVLRLSLRLK
ncbi:MAG: hypothetical protein ACM3L6_02695 [Deltaproteobacteria bacterium]